METITFYSYKGGVGRTLTLANIAIYLSRFGQNVCMIDFDLEAPGLHYKFLKSDKEINIKSGLVDYIYEFTSNKEVPTCLKEYILEISPPSKTQGQILLMPAGNILSHDYWRKLASIDWQDLIYNEASEGIPFFLDLKGSIKEELGPDFLLIDSRTGVTEMGGLCTSLLSDRVVFLITNNRENIEGANQVYKSIKMVKRLPEQKPIKVAFALTRVPTQNEGENELINAVLKSVNLSTNSSDANDICVLHSDRDLELSESLKINDRGSSKSNAPLLGDYLKLFSKIIPDEVISPKIMDVLNEITNTNDIFENPEKVQIELENFVAIYKRPITLERLANIYFLFRDNRSKTLNAFHELWTSYGIDDPKLISKYAKLFLDWSISPNDDPLFLLPIIEKYLSLNPKGKNNDDIEKKLAEAYKNYGEPYRALSHYAALLNKSPEDKQILIEIVRLCSEQGFIEIGLDLIGEYQEFIKSDEELAILFALFLAKRGDKRSLFELLSNHPLIEERIFEKNMSTYIEIINLVGSEGKLIKKLKPVIELAIKDNDINKIYQIGTLLYQKGRANDFRTLIVLYDNPKLKDIADEIARDMKMASSI
jgi:MinD-like ATPase involved in chromosome partitioning or flagellar assembly